MANATHIRLAATAKVLVEKNGRTLSFVKPSTTLLNSAKPQDGIDPAGATTVTGKACVFDNMTFDAAGTFVQREDAGLVIVAQDSLAAGTDLTEFKLVLDGGKPLRIKRRLKVAPGDVTIVWLLEVMQ